MSRVGKKPVLVPAGVSARLDGHTVAVKGAKGELKFTASDDVTVKVEGNLIRIDPRGDSKRAQAMWGTARSMIQNLVVGVTKGYRKEARDQRRRLQSGGRRQEPAVVAWLQP